MRISFPDSTKIKGLFALVLMVFLSCENEPERPIEITSPGGIVQVHFSLKEGEAFYSVTRNHAALINDSKLGFELKNDKPLNKNFKVTAAKYTSLDETWTQPWGEVKDIRNNYNSCVISLEEKSGDKRKLAIEFRVFDDGVGFRYLIPEQEDLKDFVITDEQTEFALAHDFSAWWIPAYRKETDIEMDSEYLFRNDSINSLKEKVHTPLTLQSGDSLFVSIHEAALMDYSAMTLFNKGNRVLKADLVPWSNGDKVMATAPMKTPWRAIQIASKAGDLVTSYLILNLNEPNKLGDVSWVKPGKYNGMWWGMHMNAYTWAQGPKHGATTKNVKELIDFASKHKLSAVLAEGWNEGWDGDWVANGDFNFTKPYSDFNIEEITSYAKQKNIGLIAHHETGGNVANYEKQLDEAFQLCAKYGIQRLKTGYVNKKPGGEFHQGQFMARHYQKVLETAAKYHVMLDVHEPIKDTGLRRTYPNMMAREGARGTEYEAWSIGNPPSHTTTLPFTRCLAGPLDYTPGIFNIQFDKTSKFRVHTTLAKQLALYVVIYSPMQMAADMPKYYEGNPAFKFIEDVPADWEQTKVLDGKIGQFIITVRKDRNSNDWYLGSITNEESRSQDVKLDFLTPGKKYKAEIYQDGKGANVETNPMPIQILTEEVDSKSTLTLKLAAGGGTAIRFTEASKLLTSK
ncbi:MAG: glycoside hydrolase family 97 protein [Cyclobacteriaceae bacterium]